jgi:two-component sensor histidine kinase
MNKIIYIFWTEANELTPRRKNNLQIIKDRCGVELKFLQDKEIYEYETDSDDDIRENNELR